MLMLLCVHVTSVLFLVLVGTRYYTVQRSGKDQTFRTTLHMRKVVWHMHYVILWRHIMAHTLRHTYCCITVHTLDRTVCMVVQSCLWSNG